MTQYQAGLASVFSTRARTPMMTCPQCGGEYSLGVNGTVNGCDDCAGVERAANGYVIDCCTGVDPIRCDDPNCHVHGKPIHETLVIGAKQCGYDDAIYEGIDDFERFECQCAQCRKDYYAGWDEGMKEMESAKRGA